MVIVELEFLNKNNKKYLLQISRDDISKEFVEDIADTIAMSEYGTENELKGHCFAIKHNNNYVGVVLIGEMIQSN
ncbi:hypothetical protein [Lachnoclostridium phytofermentans]|uniref:hypothetical protein n=1 Tax=Lachnoclostridium phytofermentans TaxID=66219 RepID=UPI0002FB7175|nr:hypothetical protein [Lachnoclostridium phytofermentans]